MKLHTTSREYATWQVNAPFGATLDASFDGGNTWHPMERPYDQQARILIAGPDATSNPAGTAVLPRGRNTATIRLTDNPEVVIREAGTIHIT